MDFLDDEAGVSEDDDGDDEDVLVPSSQSKENRSPSKRRRLSKANHRLSCGGSDTDSDEYDLPSNDYAGSEAGDLDALAQPRSKYDNLTHVPQYDDSQKDTFVTQLTQPWSSPTRIRGPRWKRAATPPTPVSTTMPSGLAVSYSRPNPPQQPIRPTSSFPPPRQSRSPGDEFDDDDPALVEAFMSSPTETVPNVQLVNTHRQHGVQSGQPSQPARQSSTSLRQTTLFGISTTQQERPATQATRVHNWPLASKVEPPSHHKIDPEAMKTWVYPTNLGTIRDYQFNIVHKGLFNNLLVALPTGLGKTFIAATIMLNWYRWTTDAQIIFVAPTKPLVSQQIDACFNIVGIPRSQTTMLTGEVSPAVRAEEWQDKRVFFMTPQTLINDLKNGMCDPKKIVLLVVDEAHRATGNYAYVEVVRFVRRFNSSFRVLALTATPGASVEAVQKVVDGLDIARVEIRTEDSLDIRGFVHSRNIELEVFENSEELAMSIELFGNAIKPVMNKLNSQNAYWGKDPTLITLFGLKKARDDWNKSQAGRNASFGVKGMLNSIFSVLMSLAHNLDLLKYHSIGPFFHKMKLFEAEATTKYAKQIIENEHFKKLMNRLRSWVNDPDFIGHPKLSHLKMVVLNHFMDAGNGQGRAGGRAPSDTRIMVFAHYRDSAEEIVRVLNRHGPMIRAHVFVGQAGTKGSEGMDQKTQLDIIKKFKAGTYNTLVATSIGEEGLDIGEVDLIVCYDCSKSPIRMLQRMGRTGRKRAGNIVLLLMRGKEEGDYYKAKDNYIKMQEIIESGRDFTFHEDRSPRIVPKEIIPVVDKRIVDIPIENTETASLDPRKRKPKNPKKPVKKFHMPDGVETGFKFLSEGKKSKAKKLSLEPVIDEELAVLPPLEQVLLTLDEEFQREQRYAQVSGTEPQFVQQVRLEAFPEQQHRLGKTSLVKHSSATKALVRAVKRMRKPDQNWTRPLEAETLKSFDVDNSFEHEPAQRRPQTKRQTLSRRSESLHSSSTATLLEEYDIGDSFIDDQPAPRQELDSDTELPDMVFNFSARVEQPFYLSQRSVVETEELDHELPDLVQLVGGGKRALDSESGLKNRNETNRKKARRIIDSDDDDE